MAEKKNFHRIQIDKKLLTCPMCWKLFNTPKILSCNHTVCKTCLLSLVDYTKSNKVECPNCDEKTELEKENGVDALKDNHYVRYLVQQVREQRLEDLCENCHDVTATVRCTICIVKLCGGCADAHMSDLTTVHDLAFLLEDKEEKKDLENLSHSSGGSSTNSLTIDDLPFEVFCEQCKATDCDHCINMKKVALRNIRKKEKTKPTSGELGGDFEIVVVSEFGGDDTESLNAMPLYGEDGEKLLEIAQTSGIAQVSSDVIPNSTDDTGADEEEGQYPMASTPNDTPPTGLGHVPKSGEMIVREDQEVVMAEKPGPTSGEITPKSGAVTPRSGAVTPGSQGSITPRNEDRMSQSPVYSMDLQHGSMTPRSDRNMTPRMNGDAQQAGYPAMQPNPMLATLMQKPDNWPRFVKDAEQDDETNQGEFQPPANSQFTIGATPAMEPVSPRGTKRQIRPHSAGKPRSKSGSKNRQQATSPDWDKSPSQPVPDPSVTPPVERPVLKAQPYTMRTGSGFVAAAKQPVEGVIEEEYNPERAAALAVPRSSTPTNETPVMDRKNRLGFSVSRSDTSYSDRESLKSETGSVTRAKSPTGSQHSVRSQTSQHSVRSRTSQHSAKQANGSQRSLRSTSGSQQSLKSMQGSPAGSGNMDSGSQKGSVPNLRAGQNAETGSIKSGTGSVGGGVKLPNVHDKGKTAKKGPEIIQMETEYITQPAINGFSAPRPQLTSTGREYQFNPYLAQKIPGQLNSHMQAGRGRTMSLSQPHQFSQPSTSQRYTRSASHPSSSTQAKYTRVALEKPVVNFMDRSYDDDDDDDDEVDPVLKNMVSEEDAVFNDPTLRHMVMHKMSEQAEREREEEEEESLLSVSMETEPDVPEDKRTKTGSTDRTTGTMYDKFVPIRLMEIFKELEDEISYEIEMEFETITAMPAYEDFSVEELRWQDYSNFENHCKSLMKQNYSLVFSVLQSGFKLNTLPPKAGPKFDDLPPIVEDDVINTNHGMNTPLNHSMAGEKTPVTNPPPDGDKTPTNQKADEQHSEGIGIDQALEGTEKPPSRKGSKANTPSHTPKGPKAKKGSKKAKNAKEVKQSAPNSQKPSRPNSAGSQRQNAPSPNEILDHLRDQLNASQTSIPHVTSGPYVTTDSHPNSPRPLSPNLDSSMESLNMRDRKPSGTSTPLSIRSTSAMPPAFALDPPKPGGIRLTFGLPENMGGLNVWQKWDIFTATSKFVPTLLLAAKIYWCARGIPSYNSNLKLAVTVSNTPVAKSKKNACVDTDTLTTYRKKYDPVISCQRHNTGILQLNCITHMEEYNDYSLEELRLADYIHRGIVGEEKAQIRVEDILEALLLRNAHERI